ncbi:hypothetical protein Nepgr_028746 [Nepenthes gracilis]|uniref:NPH3 domain-containing protein n=1 Tax=Nepenthes gracilis TaxID=150966 RepID=A0AAD3TCW1_NEPGR|nr:hypothetical protein Nepgr_028746 [Nepenthes gracilis]
MSTYTRKRTYRVKFQDFPGGPHGFSLMARFCSNKGNIDITPSNIVVFNHEARSLEMIKPYLGSPNLMTQTEEFLLGVDSWSWPDLLIALEHGQHFQYYDRHTTHHVQYLKNNTTLVDKNLKKLTVIKKNSSLFKTKLEKTVQGKMYYAYSLQRLVDEIVGRLSLSKTNPSASSSKSTSFRSSCDSRSTTHNTQTGFFPHYSWWFEDLSAFNVELIDMIIKAMFVEKFDHTLISKFLVYYLKNRAFNATRAETIKIMEKVIDLLFMLDKAASH